MIKRQACGRTLMHLGTRERYLLYPAVIRDTFNRNFPPKIAKKVVLNLLSLTFRRQRMVQATSTTSASDSEEEEDANPTDCESEGPPTKSPRVEEAREEEEEDSSEEEEESERRAKKVESSGAEDVEANAAALENGLGRRTPSPLSGRTALSEKRESGALGGRAGRITDASRKWRRWRVVQLSPLAPRPKWRQ